MRLEQAEETTDDARFLLQEGRFRASANRAYYAMFHAAHAALLWANAPEPHSHSGVITQFGRHIINVGLLDREFGRYLRQASDLRQRSDYEPTLDLEESRVREQVQNAQAFIAAVKRLIET